MSGVEFEIRRASWRTSWRRRLHVRPEKGKTIWPGDPIWRGARLPFPHLFSRWEVVETFPNGRPGSQDWSRNACGRAAEESNYEELSASA
jgi:hypothetical protein